MSRVSVFATVVTAATVAVLMLPSTAVAEWQFVETKEGVKLYERDARHLGEVAMLGSIETSLPMEQVVSVFVDPAQRPHWVYQADDQQLLDVSEPTADGWSERYWMRMDMPTVLVSDRDYVVHSEYRFDADRRKLTATVQSVDDLRKPQQSCCVRARSLIQYEIQELPDGKGTRIRVAIETDLAGRVPSRLVRRAAPDWPAYTLRNLVDHAGSEQVTVDAPIFVGEPES